MRILYVAKHDCGDNDDEGAIAYALEQLGHEVIKVHELKRHRGDYILNSVKADFCLFHKWEDVETIDSLVMPCVFWYFDMVYSDDPTLAKRVDFRVKWMQAVAPLCLVGFCTDGDWVQNYNLAQRPDRANLVWLMQGMDERVAGPGTRCDMGIAPIIFTGMKHHGAKRARHLEELRIKYGDQFGMLGDGGPNHRIHGRDLANLFASTKIVVAPDGPNTDRYWSNRVYLTTGLGGFLLHPWCKGLAEQYRSGIDLMYYFDRDHLNTLIDHYLVNDKSREQLRAAGYKRTMEQHTYRHRCAQLIEIVKERL